MIHDFPYTNLHALNLDWILQEVKKASDLEEQVTEAVEKAETAIETAEAASEAVSGKLDINHDLPSKYVAYMTYNNIDGIVPFSKSADHNTLAWRTEDGTIKAADPVDNDDVATKSYVDDHALSSEALADVLVGSDTVSVDLSEDETQVVVKLDQDVIDEIDGKLDASKSAVAEVGGLVVPTSAPAADKLVGIDTTNGQELIGIGTGLSISGGNLVVTGSAGGDVPTPTSSDANKVLAVNSAGTDYGWTADNSVQQISGTNFVYGRKSTGGDTKIEYASTATALTLARRDAGGVLFVGTPTADSHATTKKYVDDAIAAVSPIVITLGSGTWSATGVTVDDIHNQAANMNRLCIIKGTSDAPVIANQSCVILAIVWTYGVGRFNVKYYNGTTMSSIDLNDDGTIWTP